MDNLKQRILDRIKELNEQIITSKFNYNEM